MNNPNQITAQGIAARLVDYEEDDWERFLDEFTGAIYATELVTNTSGERLGYRVIVGFNRAADLCLDGSTGEVECWSRAGHTIGRAHLAAGFVAVLNDVLGSDY